MPSHCYKTYVLIVLLCLLALTPACGTLQPTHYGKFTFEGVVKDSAGKPVPKAWVKVRAWETLTDAEGKWNQVQIVHCGALSDHPGNFEENDAVLVTAAGYRSSEERFVVKHPGYFESCTAEQTIHFDTILESEFAEAKIDKEPTKKTSPSNESSSPPWPSAKNKKGKKGAYSL